MPQSLSNLTVHLVFSTKNRERWLHDDISNQLHPYLTGVLSQIDCPSIRVGGVADHVHLLFHLARTRCIAEVVETLKTSSSKWMKTLGPQQAAFHWQSGYGAFSVSQSNVRAVVDYIQRQPEHHKTMTFQEEYRRFLKRYAVSYDERYVWD